ncbi:MAG TPA: Lrp/AsnC ligand binding domain-containing protein [Thermoproteota archaeon]|nr:Lrp/AsnC ligand binding domain-containing protein [Thermoproteota archaeon]
MFGLCIIDVSGDVEDTVNRLKTVKGVKDAFIVYGAHDIVTLLNAKDLSEVRQIVFSIRKVPGVLRTETLIEV